MIYLASPYSHPDAAVRQARYEAVCRAAANLIEAGAIVYCPIAHSHGIGEAMGRVEPWDFWRDQDEWFLERADALYVLTIPGWESSIGVKAEVAFAHRRAISVVFVDEVKE